jgi:ArsR family transcriptional regulator
MHDREIVRALKALADPNRFRMVQELAAAGELSCGQLAAHFDLSQPTMSHHLKILVDAGILDVRAEGKHHYVRVDRVLLDGLAALLPVRLGRDALRRGREAGRAARKASA